MYVQGTREILYCVHLGFKAAECRSESARKSLTGLNLQRRLRQIHTELIEAINGWAALCFFNQMLVNDFYSQTLQHPFFRNLKLPLTLEDSIKKLNIDTNTITNTNTDTKIKTNTMNGT